MPPSGLDMGLLSTGSYETEETRSRKIIIYGLHYADINGHCVDHKNSSWPTLFHSLGTSSQLSEIIYRTDFP